MLDWRVSLKRREVQANTRDHSEEGLPGSHCVIVLGNRFVLLELGWMFPGTPPLFLGTFWLLGEASSFLGTLNWFLGTVRACPFKPGAHTPQKAVGPVRDHICGTLSQFTLSRNLKFSLVMQDNIDCVAAAGNQFLRGLHGALLTGLIGISRGGNE